MSALTQQVLKTVQEGKSTVIFSGTWLNDLTVSNQLIQPQLEVLRQELWDQQKMVIIQYSLSTGLTYSLSVIPSEQRPPVSQFLSTHLHLPEQSRQAETQTPPVVQLFRAALRISQGEETCQLADSTKIRFFILVSYAEHLFPQLQPGTQTMEQMVGIETAIAVSHSLAIRKAGHFFGYLEYRPGHLDTRLYAAIPVVHLPIPDAGEKELLLDALNNRYPEAKTDPSLTPHQIAQLTAGTPNRTMESLYLSSVRTGKTISSAELFERRQKDISNLSEGTLNPIDPLSGHNTSLEGRTILKAKKIFQSVVRGLKNQDPATTRFIIFAGGPSSGKTALAMSEAALSGLPSFQFNTPKAMYVGESERRMRNMLELFKTSGGIGIVDEVELALPMDRNHQTHDSGVTDNLIGQLQTFLSDPGIGGKCFIAATSNRPEKISEAMRQRWVIVPLISPLKEDYPAIVISLMKSLNPHFTCTETDRTLIECADRFYRVGAGPREIREAIVVSQMLFPGELGMQHLEFASRDIQPAGSKLATIYSDYCALSYCRSQSFLPWWDDQTHGPDPNFPYPDYIREILTPEFHIDQTLLKQRIHELEGLVNV